MFNLDGESEYKSWLIWDNRSILLPCGGEKWSNYFALAWIVVPARMYLGPVAEAACGEGGNLTPL